MAAFILRRLGQDRPSRPGDRHSEDRRLEWQRKVVLDHRVQARDLFGFVVAVDDCLFDQPI